MTESGAVKDEERSVADLKEQVFREIWPRFRESDSPQFTEDQVRSGVDLLFEFLEHRLGDDELDAVGKDITKGLSRWFNDAELVKLVDRYEPFCKFLLKSIDQAKYAQLQADTGNRLSAAKVLKALSLLNNKALSAFESCPWDQFPPVAVVGKPEFLEHVARTYVFRNVDDHQARILNRRQKAEIAESFCVFLVWSIIRWKVQIRCAITTTTFTDHLKEYHQRFENIGKRFVELTAETRSADEYRILDPLADSARDASPSESISVSNLPNVSRVTVIEAEPGAGKTSTLQFLAWQHASALLAGNSQHDHVPVYVDLKLLSHLKHSIESHVTDLLKPCIGPVKPTPWNSVLLLVDGLNEISPDYRNGFKSELRELLARFKTLGLVIAGRPNSFRGEFEGRIVVLRRLSDEQVSKLFARALGDQARVEELTKAVQKSPFLSSWVRTPLHAAMIVSIARQGGIDALADFSTTVRCFVRGFLNRESIQASDQTLLITKERLLSRLAFRTRDSGELAFSKLTARLALETDKLLQETIDNHLLKFADSETLQFAHEVYHDYFAATELEAREHLKAGLGVSFALANFAKPQWNECIRLFAGYSGAFRTLIEQGAEKNPFLAWALLKDGKYGDSDLIERVSGEAYCTLSAELKSTAQAEMAGACFFILADLECADLLEQALVEQAQTFEPKRLREGTPAEQDAAHEKQRQVAGPLANALLLLTRLGVLEQEVRQEGRFFRAATSAIRGLERIKAARVLCLMLSSWTGSTFSPSAVIPGVVLDALIRLGVDEILDREDEGMNMTLAMWLKRASEAGFSKAWTAYGRVLRLARRVYVAEAGLEFDGPSALHWLRLASEGGDSAGTLELSLLLLEEPELASAEGQGEQMLRHLAETSVEARFELGTRLFRGDGIDKNEVEGFGFLLSAAESGYTAAQNSVNPLLCGEYVPSHVLLPPWAKPYKERLKVLFPNVRCELR